MTNPALKEFKAFVKDFRDIGSLMVKGVIVSPLIDLWVKIGPPPYLVVGMLSAVAEVVALMWVFDSCTGSSRVRIQLFQKRALVCFIVSAIISFGLVKIFTVPRGPGKDPVVIGFQKLPTAEKLMSADPKLTEQELLRESAFNPDKIWTRQSVALIQTLLVFSWVLSFALLAVYLGAFLIFRRRPLAPKGKASCVP